MSIRERTLEVLREVANVEPETVEDTHSILMDLGADSLDVVEICMELEEEFEIELPDDKIEELNTVGDLVALVTTLVKERS